MLADDSHAIVQALTDSRPAWRESTMTPAVVFFPPGHYIITDTLPSFMYTHMLGNPNCRPLIELREGSVVQFAIAASKDFEGGGVDNFYHQIQNIDLKLSAHKPGDMNSGLGTIGLHWKVAQGTNLRMMNIDIGPADTGIFIENGGGGIVADVSLTGGDYGIAIGGQQWMFRNLAVSGARKMAVKIEWAWAFSFVGTSITNTPIGIGGRIGDVSVVSLTLVDTTFGNVKTGIAEVFPSMTSLVLDRIEGDARTDHYLLSQEVEYNIAGPGTCESGKDCSKIRFWRCGNAYDEGKELGFVRDPAQPGGKTYNPQPFTPVRPDVPMENRPFTQPWMAASSVTNALDSGCKADGVADDTAALQRALDTGGVVFLPGGVYKVSQPLTIPSGVTLIGEAWSEIQASAGAAAWKDAANPQPMLRLTAGGAGSGPLLSNLMLTVGGSHSTSGDRDLPGCIIVQWEHPNATFYDVHWRVQNAAHTSLKMIAGSGGWMENSWIWVADHDIDGQTNTDGLITVKVPYGLVMASTEPSYLVGVAIEHHFESNFNLTHAARATLIMAQTETPYWQIPPTSWMLNIEHSAGVLVYGAVGENWYNKEQLHMNQVSDCHDCTIFNLNTRSEKNADYGGPSTYMMDGDHTIKSREDTGFSANYNTDNYSGV